MIRVGSFNVHGFVGRDGRRDLPRIAQVINELDCHALGLQEVDTRGAATTLAELEDLTGMLALPGSTIVTPDGDYGNVTLTRLDVLDIILHDLTIAGREPRGAIETRLELPNGRELIMIVTHLGLRRKERWMQTQELLRICDRARGHSMLVLAGDFNEWWPSARSLHELRRRLGPSRAAASFPASRPVLALDRIWARPCTAVQSPRVVDTALAREASDHLPVVAELSRSSIRFHAPHRPGRTSELVRTRLGHGPPPRPRRRRRRGQTRTEISGLARGWTVRSMNQTAPF